VEGLWEKVVDAMWAYGPFAVVCAVLVIYIFRKNDEREKRYIGVIETLTTAVSDVADIKTCMANMDRKVDGILMRGGIEWPKS
jgi:hypothetical protein